MPKTKQPKKIAESRPDDDMTATQFMALSDAEKERIYQEIDRQNPQERAAQSTPLSATDRARWEKFKARVKKRKAGRPKFGKHGVKVIALSMERELLGRADAYAKRHGLKRAEFFTRIVRDVLEKT